MELNHFQFYSINSNLNSKKEDVELILKKLNELKVLKSEEEVKSFLKSNYGIKDDIENFNISSNIKISAGLGKKYYNVTYEYSHDGISDIKSFNYTKTERGEAWK